MEILHTVQSYAPAKNGMAEVVKQISENLVEMGHSVTVATSFDRRRREMQINGVNIIDFDIEGNEVEGMRGHTDLYRHFLMNNGFDIITNFAAQQWATDCMLPVLGEIKAKKVFVPTGFSGLYLQKYAEYFRQMKQWMPQYDMNIFLSNDYRDINFAREAGVTKYKVIPNGASAKEFLPESTINIRSLLGIPKHHFLVLLVGSHTCQKGHAEAIDIFRKSNLTNATLLIIGEPSSPKCYYSCRLSGTHFNWSPENRKNQKQILIESLSRKETVAAYHEADLFLFPSNVECSPIVLFEAMASRTPFLSTDAGNAREIVEWTHGGAILPTIKDGNGFSHADIAASVPGFNEICSDSVWRDFAARNGYQSWKDKYTWEGIARQYETVYEGLL